MESTTQQVTAPKFALGETVKFVNDNDGEAGQVTRFTYSIEEGWVYTITSRELDIPNKRIVDGFKHCREAELVKVDPQVAADANAATTNQAQQTEAVKAIDLQDQVGDKTTEGGKE